MAFNRNRLVWLLALAIPLAAAAGCPGSDRISTGTGSFAVQVEVVNNGAGFRYDFANFFIGQLTLRPVDPAADLALGTNPIGAIPGAIDIDLVSPDTPITFLALTSGEYRIESITISDFDIFDFEAGFTDCDDFEGGCTAGLSGCYPTTTMQAAYPLSDFGGQVLVPVTTDFENVLTVTFDAIAMMDALESGFSCNLATPCGIGFNAVPPPCVTSFDSSTFTSQSPNFISFQIN